jgi:hypothetical protein
MTSLLNCVGAACDESVQCGSGVASVGAMMKPLVEELKNSLLEVGKSVIKQIGAQARQLKRKKQTGAGIHKRGKPKKARKKSSAPQRGSGVVKKKSSQKGAGVPKKSGQRGAAGVRKQRTQKGGGVIKRKKTQKSGAHAAAPKPPKRKPNF